MEVYLTTVDYGGVDGVFDSLNALKRYYSGDEDDFESVVNMSEAEYIRVLEEEDITVTKEEVISYSPNDPFRSISDEDLPRNSTTWML